MRQLAPILAAVPLIFAVAACQVTTDSNNDSVEVAYNEQLAENAAADAQAIGQDVAAGAANLAEKVGNDIEREADKAQSEIDRAPAEDGNKTAN